MSPIEARMSQANGVASPKTLPPAKSGRERRVWARRASARPMPRRMMLEPNHDIADGWIVDLSIGGLSLLLSVPLEPGEILSLELESHPECRPVNVRASVVHTQQMP